MRVNTRKTFEAFMACKCAKPAASIWTNGNAIYSYGTVIALRLNDREVEFNPMRYSVTTTIHQNALRAAFAQAGITLVEAR